MTVCVRTSEPNWFPRVKDLYERRMPGALIDDAGLGVTVDHLSLHDLATLAKGRVSATQASLSLIGVVAAILAVLAGLGIYEKATKKRPPNVRVKVPGLHFEWSFDHPLSA